MNKLMLTYLAVDFLFLICGGLILGFALMSQQQERSKPTVDTVAHTILLSECPLTASIINAILIFITFTISLPALALPTNLSLLKLKSFLTIVCAMFTLILGLVIWFDTLQTRSNLSKLWAMQPASTQSLLQQRFQCCGYLDSARPAFIIDRVCPDSFTASQMEGCVGPFSSFANVYLDLVFTAAFGIVGVDVLLLLCVVMVIKHRGELVRYRHIDEKQTVRF